MRGATLPARRLLYPEQGSRKGVLESIYQQQFIRIIEQ
ncbi:hypothetical protein O23A_p0973 [Aeromonas salmonicida]|nr:hypothetical protein O23A_p0973 [Aeromonas salmonicida]